MLYEHMKRMTEATYWVYQLWPVSVGVVLAYRHVPPSLGRVGICGNASQDKQKNGHGKGAEE